MEQSGVGSRPALPSKDAWLLVQLWLGQTRCRDWKPAKTIPVAVQVPALSHTLAGWWRSAKEEKAVSYAHGDRGARPKG